MAIPPAFHGWYKSNYPTLVFNPDWLNACVEYLQSTDPQCNSTTSVLIKSVESQLLSSDLSTSILLTAPLLTQNRLLFSTRTPASAPLSDRIVFKGGKKGAVLVQIEKVQDIGHSASSLLEVLKDKNEWKKLKAKGIEGDGGRDMRLDDEDEGGIEEEEKKILAGGTGKEPIFPRGSGKFVLSDGKNSVEAFELQRINGLGLEEIKLGTKLLIHDVPFVNGIMLLTPQNTIVKGHDVEELEQFKEWSIENSLRQRLEMDLLPKPNEPEAPVQRSPTPVIPPPDAKPDIKPAQRARPAQAQQQQQQPRAGPSRAQSSSSNRRPPQPSAAHNDDDNEDDYFGDEMLGDEDGIDYDALQAQAIAKSQSQSQRKPSVQSRSTATTTSKGKGKARALEPEGQEDYDMNDFEQEEEEEEEDWNVLNEMEHRQKGSVSTTLNGKGVTAKGKGKAVAMKVKAEPRSSGGTKGAVEVLELDSDESSGEIRPPPAKRSIVTVLELDDSD
ncbi:uncharacterized protein JCM6883_004577 [Sporobolomyces salmoneus]|uniref:uncharacterized protein n=1 Tax=Sporobolomyces salmoneus TaxID=183962 RepID=UPI003181D329